MNVAVRVEPSSRPPTEQTINVGVGYRIETEGSRRAGHGVRAMCLCGWRSQKLSSAGMAGAVWDQHAEHEHQEQP